ncbi:MAG: hypothetical protein ACK4GL_00025 [Flavobacteriales bacterium]
MKNFTITLFVSLIINVLLAQNTTLRNLPEGAPVRDWMMTGTVQGTPEWGSYLGHNIYGDEAFGEKYNNTGQATVVGIVAHHRGHASGSNNEAWYRVHNVAANGLPGSVVGGKRIRLSDINRSGDAFVVMFDNPVTVNGDFFVMWDLMDYSHGTQAGDTLRLLAGEEGSRPESDHANFGRNVVRWHSHGPTAAWKDFLTQNFSPYSIYFAIYPIVSDVPASANNVDKPINLNYFPQPCRDLLNLSFDAPANGEYTLELIGLDGKRYHHERVSLAKGEQNLQFDVNQIASGNFIAIIRSGSFQVARLLQKN